MVTNEEKTNAIDRLEKPSGQPRILVYLNMHGKSSPEKIKRGIGIAQRTASGALDSLEKEGLVYIEPTAKAAYYSLTEKGQIVSECFKKISDAMAE